ncbi:MAG TPA: hypothetical protein VF108_08975 [Actinomycetota bacterium]
MRRFMVVVVIATLGAGASISPAAASHSWGGYHWARTSNPFTVQLGDNVSSSWDSYLRTAATDWSANTGGNPLNATVVAGTTRPKPCKVQNGHVEVCATTYGNNGWLGLAQIWLTSDGHIVKGVAKMNDTYYSLPKYDTPAWRGAVMCQEIGHTFGLDHQDESGADLHTCMDYASNPDADNMHPNAHDYEQLATIYSHLDSTTTIGSSLSAGASGIAGTRVDDSTFVKRFADGSRLITFVVWAR